MKTLDNLGDLPERQDCVCPSGIAISEGDEYRPLTWQEAYERERDRGYALGDLVTLLLDLDRCEHGRHEGDHCSACKGPSHGNPRVNPDRIIGYTLDAKPIRVPKRGEEWGQA